MKASNGTGPLFGIMVNRSIEYNNDGGVAGEIYLLSEAESEGAGNVYRKTGIVPQAGDRIDMVVHVRWDNSANGFIKVYLNKNLVIDAQNISTTRHFSPFNDPFGGNWKFGLYCAQWNDTNNSGGNTIANSLAAGVSDREVFISPTRIARRNPGDAAFADPYGMVTTENIALPSNIEQL